MLETVTHQSSPVLVSRRLTRAATVLSAPLLACALGCSSESGTGDTMNDAANSMASDSTTGTTSTGTTSTGTTTTGTGDVGTAQAAGGTASATTGTTPTNTGNSVAGASPGTTTDVVVGGGGTNGTTPATGGGAATSGMAGAPSGGASGNVGGGSAQVGGGGNNGVGGAEVASMAGATSVGGSMAIGGSASGGASTGGSAQGGAVNVGDLALFSFFITSQAAMRRLSDSQDGFGGDLRYGEDHGLTGADKICNQVAEASMPGSSAKVWRAFLSVSQGPEGGQVNAIERVGEGPWYDRLGRLVAETPADLLNERPQGADPDIINDLPNEDGVPNQTPNGEVEDNHHVLTGSNADGELYSATSHCNNWSSVEMSADGRPRIGFSFIAGNRTNWISGQDEGGCMAGYDVDGGGGSDPSVGHVGSGGGYGGIYCFALSP